MKAKNHAAEVGIQEMAEVRLKLKLIQTFEDVLPSLSYMVKFWRVFMFQTQPESEKADEEALNVLLAELAQMNNSKERASTLFQWLINPIPTKAFFR